MQQNSESFSKTFYQYGFSEEDLAAGRKALMPGWTSNLGKMLITKARGALIWDAEGNEYIDCTAQAWSFSVGACDQRVIDAAQKQMELITHARGTFDTVPLLLLSKKLVELVPGNLKKVSYCLHGSNAVETAMKLAKKTNPDSGPFITLFDGYHGRTFATLKASWPHINNHLRYSEQNIVRVPQPYWYRRPLGSSTSECAKIYADILHWTVKHGVDGKPAAIIMEPIQGNGGQIDFPLEYYQLVRNICDEEGIILIWDEIQTAFGRIGTMFAAEHYNVLPDIIVFGKAVAGGFPLAGVLVNEKLAHLEPGDDGYTFGHFPVSLAAAYATIEIIEKDGLLESCRSMGSYTTKKLLELKNRHPLIGDVRGPGLMIGIELVLDRKTKEPAYEETNEIYKRGLQRGVIFGTSRYSGKGNVVKIKPSLVINKDQMDKVLHVLDEILTELERE